ncbi:restriction endonuclease subunit S [Rhodococcus erythropolis]|uniref:restriction endonuclease subunit S n=1 Tax=Rhodococcus erythropolis TaxID=1833 RepID=UPI00367070D8
MTAWPTVLLGEIATIDRNTVLPSEIDSGTTYIGLENILSGGELAHVGAVEAGHLASAKFRFSPEHILYGKLRPYLAKIAISEYSGVCSTDILPIRPSKGLDKQYLLQVLRQPSMIDLANARSSGANLPRLSPTELLKFTIPFPPLAEQRRIAAILDHVDALRAKRRKALTYLSELNRSIFQELDRRVDDVISVEDAVEKIIDYRGKSPVKTSFGVPLVTAKIIKDGRILPAEEFIAERDYSEWMRRGLPIVGDVLFTSEAPLGSVAQIVNERVALAQRVILLRAKHGIFDNTFLMHALRSVRVRDRIDRRSTGSTVRGIRQSELRKVLLPIPPLAEQLLFSDAAKRISLLELQNRTALSELDTLFASLQSRAFRGEL